MSLLLILFFVAAALFHLYHHSMGRRKTVSKLPPSPPGCLPLLGHLPWLGKEPHKVIMKWSRMLGPVLKLKFGSFQVVAINDTELIKKAFRSSELSGRPRLKVFDDLSLQRQGMVLSDGPAANDLRNFFLKHLKGFTTDGDTITWRVLKEVRSFLHGLKNLQGRPCQVKGIFNRHIVNTLLSILVGQRFEAGDDQAMQLADMVAEVTRIPNLVELIGMYLPILSTLFPGVVGYSKRIATRDHIHKFFQDIIEDHKRTKVAGQPRDIMDSFLDRMEETADTSSPFHPYSDSLVVSMAEIFAAAMETTSIQLEWIVYYMAKYPKIQGKMQAEIDHVLGSREPSLSDRTALPYVEAVVLEALRTPTPGPLGVQHRALSDFELDGLLIPKESMVLSNMFAAHHDPDVWGDPENFRPERFIVNDDDGTPQLGGKKDKLVPFSHGKRSCIGETLARNQLFLFTVSISQKFCVKPSDVALPDEKIFGMTLAPAPFTVTFLPRFQD